MKKKGLLITIIIGVVLLIVGLVLLFLSGPKKTNKQLFTEAIGKSFGLYTDSEGEETKIESAVKEVQKKISSGLYKVTLNGKFTEGEAGYTKLDSTIYVGQDQFYISSSLNSNDKLYDVVALLKDNKVYMSVKDVLSKFYYIENMSDIVGDSKDAKLVEKLVNYIADSLMDSIKEEDVVTSDEELNINGNKYNTKKYGYTFSGNTLYTVIESIANKIKNDKEIVDEINKIIKSSDMPSEFGNIEINQQDFNQIIDELLEYAKEVKNLGNLFTLSVYTFNNFWNSSIIVKP